MNISNVNIKAIVNKLTNSSQLSSYDVKLINRILFSNENKLSFHADVIIVLGNPTCLEDRIVKAVELMRKGFAEYIVLSGGVLIPQSSQTESISMYQYCLDFGLPKERIIVENESTTTRENIILSAHLISNLDLSNPRIVAISSATHIRRVMMNFDKFKFLFPANSTFDFIHSIHPSCSPYDWFLYSNAKQTVATELLIIEQYLSEYNYPSFEI